MGFSWILWRWGALQWSAVLHSTWPHCLVNAVVMLWPAAGAALSCQAAPGDNTVPSPWEAPGCSIRITPGPCIGTLQGHMQSIVVLQRSAAMGPGSSEASCLHIHFLKSPQKSVHILQFWFIPSEVGKEPDGKTCSRRWCEATGYKVNSRAWKGGTFPCIHGTPHKEHWTTQGAYVTPRHSPSPSRQSRVTVSIIPWSVLSWKGWRKKDGRVGLERAQVVLWAVEEFLENSQMVWCRDSPCSSYYQLNTETSKAPFLGGMSFVGISQRKSHTLL